MTAKFGLLINANVSGENNIRRLGNSMQGVQGKVNNLKMAVGGLSTAFKALGAALAVGAFVRGAQDALQMADAVGKLSTRTGIAANTLFAYRNAAELADVSNEQLTTGLLQLSKNMLEAAKGTETYAAAYRALGVSVVAPSGQLRSANEVFEDIADRFKDLPDGATKAAVAMRLFGRSGAQLIPLLNGGSDALTKLGFGLSKEFTEKAQLFNDTMAGIGRRFTEIQLQILDYFLPTFQMIGDAFADLFASSSGDWTAFGALIQGVLRGVGFAVYGTIAGIRFLSRVIGDLVRMTQAIMSGEGLGAAVAIAKKGIDDTARQAVIDRNNLSQLAGGTYANERPDRTGYSRRLTGGSFDMDGLLDGGSSKSAAANKKADDDERAAKEAERLAKAQMDGLLASRMQLQASEAALAIAKEANPLRRTELEFDERKRVLMAEFATSAQESLTTSQDLNIERQLAVDLETLQIERQKALKDATDATSTSFSQAFSEKIDAYRKNVEDFGGQVADAVTGAFQGMEDALVDFVTTGKANFADLARSIIADITRIAIRQAIIKPLVGALFPGATENALGNVYSANGIVPFAKGGIVNAPTYFPFAKGVGLMGEAGPEAIMPLKRGPGGRLGVESSGGGKVQVGSINISVQNTGEQLSAAAQKQIATQVQGIVMSALVNEQRSGGVLR
jgi:lambda family phage tail tape measure protein